MYSGIDVYTYPYRILVGLFVWGSLSTGFAIHALLQHRACLLRISALLKNGKRTSSW